MILKQKPEISLQVMTGDVYHQQLLAKKSLLVTEY